MDKYQDLMEGGAAGSSSLVFLVTSACANVVLSQGDTSGWQIAGRVNSTPEKRERGPVRGRNLKKTPRASPSSAGESRLPASGSCRAYTGPAQTALCEDEDVVTTRRKEEEGFLSRTGPGLVNITPGPGPLMDEDVDFSQPQENGTERLLRLMHRKKMRGHDDIPKTVKHRDIRSMTPTPLPLLGARGSQSRVALTRGLDIPASPTGRRYPDYDSEDWRSDSDMSSVSVDSECLPAIPGRDTPRERRRPGDNGATSLRKEAVPKPKRGRGRPPTTGTCVGEAAVRAELNRQKEEALRLEAEAKAEVTDMVRGRLRVGWVTARVALLASRPKRCFRCQDNGHVAVNCKCVDDRGGICFRCGAQGHKAAECGTAETNCFLCEDASREEQGHVLGSSAGVSPSKPAPHHQEEKGSRQAWAPKA